MCLILQRYLTGSVWFDWEKWFDRNIWLVVFEILIRSLTVPEKKNHAARLTGKVIWLGVCDLTGRFDWDTYHQRKTTRQGWPCYTTSFHRTPWDSDIVPRGNGSYHSICCAYGGSRCRSLVPRQRPSPCLDDGWVGMKRWLVVVIGCWWWGGGGW